MNLKVQNYAQYIIVHTYVVYTYTIKLDKKNKVKKNDKIQVSSYPGEGGERRENRVGTWVAGKAFNMYNV